MNSVVEFNWLVNCAIITAPTLLTKREVTFHSELIYVFDYFRSYH